MYAEPVNICKLFIFYQIVGYPKALGMECESMDQR
jgi:hypothetical protein